jgi:micrococcal nuclease
MKKEMSLTSRVILTLVLVLISINSGLTADLLRGKVTRVVDGDTIEVSLGTRVERVRLIGVDTPELGTIEGQVAKDYTEKNLSGAVIFLELDAQTRDRYGRLLAYIWTKEPKTRSESEIRDKMFNARLLLEGHGVLLTIPPNVKYVEYFTKFQQAGRENKMGIWSLDPEDTRAPPKKKTSYPYIGNRNTYKFHWASCRYVGMMNPKNKVPFRTREEAIRAGYIPCKVCKP